MKLDIQRFSTFQFNQENIDKIKNDLNTTATETVDILKQITAIVSQVNGTGLFGSVTSTITDILKQIDDFSGNKFSPAITSFSNLLASVSQAVGDLEIDYSSMIDGWASDMQSAMSLISSGINSTVEKGSYNMGTYITDMSNSGRTIVKEVATMIKNTGDVYKSYTGQSIAETAKGAFSAVLNFASTGGSSLKSLISSFNA